MAATEDSNNHVIKINGPEPPIRPEDQSITEKQRRALKKKKKKKLKSIGKRHPEFELTYDMMLGIRYAVSLSEPSVTTTTTRTRTVTATHTVTTTKSKPTDHLSASAHYNYNTSSRSFKSNTSMSMSMPSGGGSSSDDETDSDSDDELERLIESEFLETKKYKFPSSGSETTPAHQMSDFKFKDYCPQIFRQLREWFRISTQEYLVTICGDFKLLEFISNSKSGQFFFFSHNSQFIIKTMTRTESRFLRKILPTYYTYVSQQPDTLLPKFYGMHRVKRKKQKIYFLIQQNVFYSDVDDIHDQYDLKGSTQGRRATKAERKKGAILKDLDWVDQVKTLAIGKARAKLFKDQLKRDTHWLRREKIMDYSLLVGIHYLNRAKTTHNNLINMHMLVDHSTNDNDNEYDEDVLYSPPLSTVEENKEEIYEHKEVLEEEEEELQEEEEEEEAEAEASTHLALTLRDSVTSATGDEDNDGDGDRQDIDSVGSDYIPTRRNSAPTIASPIAKELTAVNSSNRYRFRIDLDESDHVSRNRSHTKSQSLQLMNSGIDVVVVEQPQPSSISKTVSLSLRATSTSCEKPSHKYDVKYRGHISVKHPKRYKRKTAAEMQFPVDDIDIPVGIKHEVHQDIDTDLLFENETQQQEKKADSDYNCTCAPKAECKEDINMDMNMDANNSGDICPWTTFRGGMDSVDGNEVYFVGLIDILQKYNKRKKLENWIKKMKYDKHAISAAPPDLYAQRMCDFFEDKVI